MKHSYDISVVIPAYNEELTIQSVVDSVYSLVLNKQVIIVNDGSTDNTPSILSTVSKKYSDLVVIHTENKGKGAALREGFKYIEGEYTVIQDADLEYDPRDIGRMYNYAKANKVKVVYGNRFTEKRFYDGMNWKNFLGNNIILPYLASALYGQWINDEATCYKMFETKLLKSLSLKCKRFEFCPEVTAKVRKKNERIYEIPINYYPRSKVSGKKLNALKDGLEAVWTLLKYRFKD